MFSTVLLQRSKTLSDLLRSRILTRPMGGGPRTFPGGLNKWQWKRLHEKKAKEKERRLLDQEKQLYQARIRSQVRAKLAGKPDSSSNTTKYNPMSPNDHIKALADRFMKEGAVDLWNENDGPLKSEEQERPRIIETTRNQRSGSIYSPLDVKKLISDKRMQNAKFNVVNSNHFGKSRSYSVQSKGKFRVNESSFGRIPLDLDSKDDSLKHSGRNIEQRRFKKNESSASQRESDFVSNDNSMKRVDQGGLGGNRENESPRNFRKFRKSGNGLERRRFRRNESSSSDDEWDSDIDDEVEGVGGGRDVRKLGSSASLGKYDVKITKRVPLKELEKDIDFSEQVELLRKELDKKKLAENDEKKGEGETIYSQKRFDECGISPLTIKALSAAGYFKMTRVQEATLSVCLEGKDALVKAKTGTGKTAAFLLPAIETVLKAASSNTIQRAPPIYVLILCPTRELASQLAAEANALLKYHDGIGVQTLVGGTRFKVDQKRLESDPCQIIVATPGRLLDHVENKSTLSVRLMGLKMLILDEADHLLDLGFRKDVEKIVDCLPRQRQSLLFSATIPKEVRRISQLVLKREHAFIDTVGLGCVETHDKVKQSLLVAPHELHFQIVHHLLKKHISQAPDYKVIVFCTTGMVTSLVYLLLREMNMNVREIHSRKPQLYRTRISDEFRESGRLILVTSDVSARGMDYPDVTLVIQVGIPPDREQYIHRLGRTGREGKGGEGILLIAPWEEYFLDEIKDLPLEKLSLPHMDPDVKQQLEFAMAKIDGSIKEAAYHAWLGYYNSIREIGRDKTTLVELANQFSMSIGLQRPPPLFRKTAIKMGLKDIPGIRIRK
ncbi:PREDICTED: probable DEAD-box ATP-dependent RNA helicase 48 isoform X1 [Theobroma cacao]|uniref:ATP-dependent RNA helicase n=1 Tax=Theobroma cacao TaxID=3641 RepID=A0AB32VET4_THECC|nr:PREDICTED: probable DEAD-box ATP-dependent RNA helicase 48 isoform X1 [Theobroma cacao]